MALEVREVERGKETTVIEVDGIVDSTNVEEFLRSINSVFKKGVNRIVLDLANTSYLSSGGISVIVDAFKRARKQGGKLVIARASDLLYDLFQAVQIDMIIDFYDSLEEALKAV